MEPYLDGKAVQVYYTSSDTFYLVLKQQTNEMLAFRTKTEAQTATVILFDLFNNNFKWVFTYLSQP